MIIVDDGSVDNTPEIIKSFASRKNLITGYNCIKIVTRKDRGFSGLSSPYMAKTYNDGFKVLNKLDNWKWVAIISADNLLPEWYFEKLFERIKGKYFGVASGVATYRKLNPTAASGGGRVVKREVLQGLGGYYPVRYDWEGCTTRYSLYTNLNVGSFSDIYFYSTRVQGKGHLINYRLWGIAEKQAGSTLLSLIIKTIRNIKNGKFTMGLSILIGFLTYRYKPHEKYILFWNNYQKYRMKIRLIKVIDKIIGIG